MRSAAFCVAIALATVPARAQLSSLPSGVDLCRSARRPPLLGPRRAVPTQGSRRVLRLVAGHGAVAHLLRADRGPRQAAHPDCEGLGMAARNRRPLRPDRAPCSCRDSRRQIQPQRARCPSHRSGNRPRRLAEQGPGKSGTTSFHPLPTYTSDLGKVRNGGNSPALSRASHGRQLTESGHPRNRVSIRRASCAIWSS